MSRMNSDQIAAELLRLGAKLYRSPMYAHTYELPLTAEKVCVKRGGAGKPMQRQPLLIHPRHRDLPHWDALLALAPDPNLAYHNADLHGFPLGNTGASKVGIAFDVASPQVLALFVDVLTSVTRVAVDPMLHIQRAGAEALLKDDPQFIQALETVREQLIEARIGQGRYRQELMTWWQGQCAVTGAAVSEALIASHIKPWAKSDNTERLDVYNGLLLSANMDRLFDRGLIGFADDGRLIRSRRISDVDLACLGIQVDARLRRVAPQHLTYLAHHRQAFGLD